MSILAVLQVVQAYIGPHNVMCPLPSRMLVDDRYATLACQQRWFGHNAQCGWQRPTPGAPCPRADDAFNKCPPLLERNQWRHAKKKPTYFYLRSSSCANVIQCGKVKVPCKFK